MNDILPINNERLVHIRKKWNEELAFLKDLPCETPEHEAWWSNVVSVVQADLRELETERTTLMRPILDDQKRINGDFKEAAAPAEAVKKIAVAKVKAFAEATLAAQEALRLAAQTAAASGDAEGCQAALAAIPEASGAKGTRTVWVWEYAVEDFTAVPDAFKVVADAALKAHCKLAKGEKPPAPIAGIRFERRANVGASGR